MIATVMQISIGNIDWLRLVRGGLEEEEELSLACNFVSANLAIAKWLLSLKRLKVGRKFERDFGLRRWLDEEEAADEEGKLIFESYI